MKRLLSNKWIQFAIVANALLLNSGCVLNSGDVADAATAPIIGAIGDVVTLLLTAVLTNIGLLPA